MKRSQQIRRQTRRVQKRLALIKRCLEARRQRRAFANARSDWSLRPLNKFCQPVGGNGLPYLTERNLAALNLLSSGNDYFEDSGSPFCAGIVDDCSVGTQSPLPEGDDISINTLLSLSMLSVGAFLPKETGKYEYKETCMPRQLLDYNLEEIFSTGIFPQPLKVLCNRTFYETVVKFYTHYLAAFLNTRGGLYGGKLVIGITDSGRVDGLLYFGKPSVRILRKMLRLAVAAQLHSDQLVPGALYRMIKVEIKEVHSAPVSDEKLALHRNRCTIEDRARKQFANLKRFLELIYTKMDELNSILRRNEPELDCAIEPEKAQKHAAIIKLFYEAPLVSAPSVSEAASHSPWPIWTGSLGMLSLMQISTPANQAKPSSYFLPEQTCNCISAVFAEHGIRNINSVSHFALILQVCFQRALLSCGNDRGNARYKTRRTCYSMLVELLQYMSCVVLASKNATERLLPDGTPLNGSTFFREVMTPNIALPFYRSVDRKIGCHIAILHIPTNYLIPEQFIVPGFTREQVRVYYTCPETGAVSVPQRCIGPNREPATRNWGCK